MSSVNTFFQDLYREVNDNFLSIKLTVPLSNCCNAKAVGEITDDNVGRCSDCFEPAEFTEESENDL